MNTEVTEQTTTGRCACGRSPLGHCIGWHKLTEDEFRQALAEWDAKIIPKNNLVE